MQTYTCVQCGGKYTGHKRKYCSDECKKEARRAYNRERWRKQNPDWNKTITKKCEHCNKTYEVQGRYASQSRYCSNECQQAYYSRQKGHKPMKEYREEVERQKQDRLEKLEEERKAKIKTKECSECGQPFETMQPSQLTCSTECSRLRENRLRRYYKEERYNETNIIDKDISVKVLYKRDKGICYICGGKCDFNDNYEVNGYFTAGPNYPSIDHIIPIARGGMHAWDNVKLAHHHCNSKKSDILPSELELDTEIEEAYALARKVSPRKKQVRQFNKDGKLINVYESTAEAERQTGIKVKGIQKCAREECKTYRGFKWEYA